MNKLICDKDSLKKGNSAWWTITENNRVYYFDPDKGKKDSINSISSFKNDPIILYYE